MSRDEQVAARGRKWCATANSGHWFCWRCWVLRFRYRMLRLWE